MGGGPIRSCAGCRRRRPQAELIRIVRRPDGTASVDPGTPETMAPAGRRPPPRSPGRGAYLCVDRACAGRALRSGALARALRLWGPVPPELTTELEGRIAAAAASRGEEERDG